MVDFLDFVLFYEFSDRKIKSPVIYEITTKDGNDFYFQKIVAIFCGYFIYNRTFNFTV
jgi:hypothetical protein